MVPCFPPCYPVLLWITLCYLVVRCVRLCYPGLPGVTVFSSVFPCILLCYPVLPCVTLDYPVLPCGSLCYAVLPWITLCYPLFPCVPLYSPVLSCVTLFTPVLCINQQLPLRAHPWAPIGTQGHLSQLTDICCLRRVWRKMPLLLIEIAPQGADIGDLLVSVIPY